MALFDFTSLFAAEHSSRIIRRHGKTLLLMLAGDSLLEVTIVTTVTHWLLTHTYTQPFWPTGTGLARGFLGALDAAWMIRQYAASNPPIQLLSERECLSVIVTNYS